MWWTSWLKFVPADGRFKEHLKNQVGPKTKLNFISLCRYVNIQYFDLFQFLTPESLRLFEFLSHSLFGVTSYTEVFWTNQVSLIFFSSQRLRMSPVPISNFKQFLAPSTKRSLSRWFVRKHLFEQSVSPCSSTCKPVLISVFDDLVMRGEISNSWRITSFLSVSSRLHMFTCRGSYIHLLGNQFSVPYNMILW